LASPSIGDAWSSDHEYVERLYIWQKSLQGGDSGHCRPVCSKLPTPGRHGQHLGRFNQHIRQHLVARFLSVRLVKALDQEWRELVASQRTAVRRWADRYEVLTTCQTLDDVLSLSKQKSDAVLLALLTEVSRDHDQLAARVVLQTLVGRMVRMAQRDPRGSTDDYLAALWCVINSYPLSRRPARIAANLSLDTLKAVSNERRWLRRGDVSLWPSSESLEELLAPVGLDGSPYDSLLSGDIEVRRVLEAGRLLSLIETSDALLLQRVYAEGWSGDRAAREFRMAEGTVRVRCSKAVRRLAAHAVELADAAA
jgi:hypothetical protein